MVGKLTIVILVTYKENIKILIFRYTFIRCETVSKNIKTNEVVCVAQIFFVNKKGRKCLCGYFNASKFSIYDI